MRPSNEVLIRTIKMLLYQLESIPDTMKDRYDWLVINEAKKVLEEDSQN